jgi:hypothetical protein
MQQPRARRLQSFLQRTPLETVLASRIDDIRVTAAGTVTAGVVRLFVHDGTNARLWQEVMVTATTPSTTVQTFNTTLYNQALILPNGWSLRASTNNAETFHIVVTRAGDF